MTGLLVDQLKAWFAQQELYMPTPERPLLLAVSGGADSIALAFLAREAFGEPAIAAMTVDHGLRSGSYAEARWTKAQLNRSDIRVCLEQLKLGSSGGNTQAQARLARYAALERCAARVNAVAVATAHTLDDQAETVLARLARASGTRGLSAMRDVARVPSEGGEGGAALVRPLLGVSREALRSYLRQNNHRWAEDPSNRQKAYDRVRLRLLLKQWTEADFDISRIAKSAEHLARSEDALEHYAELAYRDIVESRSDGSICVRHQAFRVLPEDIQFRLLKRLLIKVSGVQGFVRFDKLARAREVILLAKAEAFTLHHTKITVDMECFLIQAH